MHSQACSGKAAFSLNVGRKPSWNIDLLKCKSESKLSRPEFEDWVGQFLVDPYLGYFCGIKPFGSRTNRFGLSFQLGEDVAEMKIDR